MKKKDIDWAGLALCSERGEILPVDPSNPKRGYFVPQAAAQKWLDFIQRIPVEIAFSALKGLPYFQKGSSRQASLVVLKPTPGHDRDQPYANPVLYMNDRAFTALQKFNRRLTPTPALPPMTSLPVSGESKPGDALLASDFVKALLNQLSGAEEKPRSPRARPPAGPRKPPEPK